MIVQAAYDQFLSLDSVRQMGWWNVLWVILVAFLFLAARARKIGATSIGKNEWGMLEILGFPLIPIPFGLWPFIKGVFHVKQVSTAPVRIELPSRRDVAGRVLLVITTVLVRVTQPISGNPWQRFLQLRKDLIAALYGTLDEDTDDAENLERIEQTRAVLEAASRNLLKDAKDVDVLTVDALNRECGEDLRVRFGEYIDKVFIREDAPVDGQLWKEGRKSLVEDEIEEEVEDDDMPPAQVIGINSSTKA